MAPSNANTADSARRLDLPSGTVAFLFTDIAGSTRLLEALGTEAYARVLADHRRILRGAFERWRGSEISTQGDSFFVAFSRVSDAIQSAVEAQLGLADHDWPGGESVQVRMAVHAGEALSQEGEYVGMEVHRGARIMAAGFGGQVLLSSAAAALVRDQLPDGVGLSDLGEQVLKDLPQPERVFQVTHAGLQPFFPPQLTAAAPVNLPAQASAFIGRQELLTQIAELLEDSQVRLVTLTGPGGTGKTRLALRVAEAHASRYPDGVRFVDLAPATETSAALALIIQALGQTLGREQSAIELLKHALGSTRTLLLLDNFEQVTAAATAVAELLQACAGLTVLATSREPLHIRAERVVPVRAMSLPPADASAADTDLGAFEAIQLFVERARAVVPDFRMTDENAAAILEICRRLDGLPLAIELATARLKLFSPEGLRDRLSRSLDVLRSGARDLPERQRTMHATIDWSYGLLEPREQQLFVILSVFSSAGYDAIERVVSAVETSPSAEVDILDGIASLLDKSLLRQRTADAEERVGMLETIRDFAAERLRERPDLEAAARRAHANVFAALAADADPAAPPTVEIENLWSAWRYGVEQGDLTLLEAMNEGLWRANEALGLYRATIDQATDLLAVLEASPTSPERRARQVQLQMRRLRSMLVVIGYTSEVEEAAVQAIETFESNRVGVEDLLPVLRILAGLYELRTEFEKSGKIARRILDLANERDDGEMRASAHLVLAASASFTGDPLGANAHFDKTLAWYAAHPPTVQSASASVHAAVAAHNASALNLQLLGFPDQAAARAERGIDLARSLGHTYSLAYANYHAGFLYLWLQEPDHVLRCSRGVLDAIGNQEIAVWRALGQVLAGAANVGLGAADKGLAQLDAALDAYRGLRTPPIFWPLLQLVRATAYLQAGRLEAATTTIEEAASTPGYGSLPQFDLLRGALALSSPDRAGAETAAAHFGAAYETSVAAGVRMTQLQAAIGLRRVGQAAGTDVGLAELRITYESFTEGFATRDLVAARELLESAAP